MMLSVPYIHAEAQTPVTTVASRGVQDENQEPDGFPSLQELGNYSKVIKGYSSLAPRRSEGLNVPMPMALSPNTFTAHATSTDWDMVIASRRYHQFMAGHLMVLVLQVILVIILEVMP